MAERFYYCGHASEDEDAADPGLADCARPEIADELYGSGIKDWCSVPSADDPATYIVVVGVTPIGFEDIPLMQEDGVTPVEQAVYDAALDACFAAGEQARELAHTALAYDPETNPMGYDWFVVEDDGTVTYHAKG